MDAFATLGLPTRAGLTEEEITSAYFSRSKTANPEEQAALNAARENLGRADLRLKHLLEIAGPPEAAQWRTVQMPDDLMLLFSQFGNLRQKAEALLKKRDTATTALGKAVLQPAVLGLRAEAETLAEQMAQTIEQREELLPALDAQLAVSWQRLAELQAHLAYLLKWQLQVRELLFRLV
jgi:hypothetical protein